ncbi:MAG: hypothetical protein R2697_18925 [Ilumatobacteraceae bacterium]
MGRSSGSRRRASRRALPPHRRGFAVGLVGSGIGLGLVFAGQLSAFLDRRSDAPDLWQTMYRIELAIAVAVLAGAFAVLREQGDGRSLSGGFGGSVRCAVCTGGCR